MSEPVIFPQGFHEHWLRLQPQRRLARAELGSRLWPGLDAAGRAEARELLRTAREDLEQQSAPDASTPEAGRLTLAQRLIDRESVRLERPPRRGELAALAATALGPAALAADAGLVCERLERLPELWSAASGEVLGGDPDEGAAAARRLRALALHLEIRLGAERNPRPLLELAELLERQPAAAEPDPAPHPDLDTAGGWERAPLLARLEEESARAEAELERRAAALCQRLEGRTEAGDAVARALAQLALDPPRPEHWAWLQRGLQADLARFLRRLGLAAEAPEVEAAPGLAPDLVEPRLDASGRLLASDLSLPGGAELRDLLAERCHAQLPLLAAREGLPGRAWLLARLRAGAGASPAAAVIAALLEPEDLEAWARWAGDWALRRGWQAGDPRLRLLQARQELRELQLARADLELVAGVVSPTEARARLEPALELPPTLFEAAWSDLRRRPGAAAAAAARLLEVREAGRRWRRAARGAGNADWFHLLAEAAALPPDWLRRHLAQQPARGLAWNALPPALVRPAPRPDGLLGEVEERLAALGRIRREDLEAGREYDAVALTAPESPEAGGEGTDDAPAE